MRISDWSSDVCSSDLYQLIPNSNPPRYHTRYDGSIDQQLTQLLDYMLEQLPGGFYTLLIDKNGYCPTHNTRYSRQPTGDLDHDRSEEHTSELQSLMRISYAVFCLKKKTLITTKSLVTNQSIHTYANNI